MENIFTIEIERAKELDKLLAYLCNDDTEISTAHLDTKLLIALKANGLISIEPTKLGVGEVCRVLDRGYEYNKNGGFVGELNRQQKEEVKEKRERNSDLIARIIGIVAIVLSILSLVLSFLQSHN